MAGPNAKHLQQQQPIGGGGPRNLSDQDRRSHLYIESFDFPSTVRPCICTWNVYRENYLRSRIVLLDCSFAHLVFVFVVVVAH